MTVKKLPWTDTQSIRYQLQKEKVIALVFFIIPKFSFARYDQMALSRW